jgi:adenosylcobinamide-phosphate synthase
MPELMPLLLAWLFLNAWILIAVLVIEAMVGYPAWLHARIPHPVVWAGYAIGVLDRRWNKPEYSFAKRRLLGCLAVLLVSGAGFAVGAAVEDGVAVGAYAVGGGPTIYGEGSLDGTPSDPNPKPVYEGNSWINLAAIVVLAFVASAGLAQRSLFVHVKNVLDALRAGDLTAARQRVSMIVGRDTQQLDVSAVSAAALESLAESFNDGVVAPAFWFFLGGLPGLCVYKVLNTADSLIGHKEERWRAFGWAAARADDLANLIPARIAGLLLVLAGFSGLAVMFKDASKHASPNAGWPEAAMAGALGIRLGGPTAYDGVIHERPVFGTGPVPAVEDLTRGLRLYVIACLLQLSFVVVIAVTPLLLLRV